MHLEKPKGLQSQLGSRREASNTNEGLSMGSSCDNFLFAAPADKMKHAEVRLPLERALLLCNAQAAQVFVQAFLTPNAPDEAIK